MPDFGETLTTIDELRMRYHQPSDLVKAKKFTELDARFREFLAISPFCLIATSSADGALDVSPRGGPPGFVRALDDQRLAIPDLSGNNLLDSATNIVDTGTIGLLVTVPGEDETIRINGRACITVDPEILSLWDGELRTPKIAIGIEVVEVFHHCAKAFRRGGLWDPTSWPDQATVPDFCNTYVERFELGLPADQLRGLLEDGYAEALAEERAP